MSNGGGAASVEANRGQYVGRPAGASGVPPSLFSGKTGPETVSNRQSEPISILSSLDEGGRTNRPGEGGIKGLLFVVLGLCLLSTALAIGMLAFDGNDPKEQVIQPVMPVSASRPPEASPQRPMEGAAMIENVALPTTTASSADTAVALAEGVAAISPQEHASASTSRPFTALDRAPEIPATTTDTRKKVSPVTAVPAPKARSGRGDANRSLPPSDSDAALLAALVAHEEGASVRSGKQKQTPVVEKEAAPTSASSTTRGRASRFDPKRDVVLDEKELTTAELVRRCGSLGLVEGFLCKQRVCAAQTGSDPACPQAAQPSISGG